MSAAVAFLDIPGHATMTLMTVHVSAAREKPLIYREEIRCARSIYNPSNYIQRTLSTPPGGEKPYYSCPSSVDNESRSRHSPTNVDDRHFRCKLLRELGTDSSDGGMLSQSVGEVLGEI